jgi:predicted ribosome quality control (RQC) complex YloA/Tae2 family protein
MPQDAFNLRRNVLELQNILIGGKINKVVQPDKDDLVFYIYTGKSLLKLVLSTSASSARVCLTTADEEVPAVAPNFCMLLRKHVIGAEIKKIEQVAFERIVAITLHCVSDFTCADRVLYTEVMGKYSNVVLTENGVILGALKTTSLEENCKRILFPGAKYTLPAPQDKADPTDKAALTQALRGFSLSADKADYLFKNVAGIAYSTAVQMVTEYEKLSVPEPIADFVADYLFGGETSPCLLSVNGVPKDFSAKPLDGGVPCASLQQAQDILYSYNGQKKAFEEKKRRLLSVVQNRKKKEEKKLGQILEKLKECEGSEEYRLSGELITANIYQLERGMSECRLPNYYDPDYKEKKIALDKTLTPSQNAQKYYKKYAKLKRTVEALAPRKEEEEAELAYTESILFALSQAEETGDLADIEEELISLGLLKPKAVKQKKVADVPFRKYEKDGFTILAGRNNVQNDKLVRSAAKNDIWLHTQKYHSSHVVVVTEGRKVPNEVLEYAAALCARFSDGKHGSKIPVDYCEIRFVKKPSKAKAGFVVYTDYKTLLVDPLAN